jgi:hypothetical protein
MDDQMKIYMEDLERKILIPGLLSGLFNTQIKIHTRPQKLAETEFGKFIGTIVDSEQVFVIDYYGLTKKSTGFLERVRAFDEQGIEVRALKAPVAYFAGIKIEHLSSNAPELLSDFSKFKKLLVGMRNFPERILRKTGS